MIIIDTREQTPFDFGEEVIYKKLDIGDYSIEGFENEIAIERKSVSDAIGSVLGGRRRFEREWQRALNLKRFVVVIEGRPEDILNELINIAHRTKKGGKTIMWKFKTVMNTYYGWSLKYNVPVFFCKNRRDAQSLTKTLLNMYVKYKKRGDV